MVTIIEAKLNITEWGTKSWIKQPVINLLFHDRLNMLLPQMVFLWAHVVLGCVPSTPACKYILFVFLIEMLFIFPYLLYFYSIYKKNKKKPKHCSIRMLKDLNVMAAMEVIWVMLGVQPGGLRRHWRWMRVVSPGGEVTVTGGMWMEVWPVRLTFLWLSESSGWSGGQLPPPEPCWGERASDSPSESPNRSLEQRQHVNIQQIQTVSHTAGLGGKVYDAMYRLIWK